MPPDSTPRLSLLLGSEARMRLRLQRMLTASGVYLFSVLSLQISARMGLTEPWQADDLSIFILVSQLLIYALLRSGLSERLQDPACTMSQMVLAIATLSLSYHIAAHTRGMLLMVVALVLVFGAFTLRPRQCRRLGWLAVALLGLTMAHGSSTQPARYDPVIEAFHFVFALAVLPTLAYLAGELSGLRISQREQKHALREALARVQQLATRDELTGLPNRRHVQEWMAHELARQERQGALLCVALIDLDHFKRINDTHGHAAGDEVLRRFSQGARAVLRQGDVMARWGGEEFMLVMPSTTLAQASEVLLRVQLVMRQPASWGDSPGTPVSFSAGLTAHLPSEPLDEAVQRADRALYAAKHAGRDRIVSEPPPAAASGLAPAPGRSAAAAPSASALSP
jgi:diguanylate cyclase (GGDEF)-like protein